MVKRSYVACVAAPGRVGGQGRDTLSRLYLEIDLCMFSIRFTARLMIAHVLANGETSILCMDCLELIVFCLHADAYFPIS